MHDNDNQPDWIDLLQPDHVFDDFCTTFNYDDGGPQYDWNEMHSIYPDNSKNYFENLSEAHQDSDTLRLPTVNLEVLNDDQRFAYCLVMDTIMKSINGEENSDLRMVVAGQAGSGKTFLINALVYSIRNLYQSNAAVQALGPTGNSAHLLFDGMTIHSFLKIPTGKKRTQDMSPPVGAAAEKLQENFKGLQCLIIDERSLVGCNMLGWMEFHSEFAKKTLTIGVVCQWLFFGGMTFSCHLSAILQYIDAAVVTQLP